MNSMRQLEERHVATKIELMVWSNKMDLLAFSNTKGEVALHRLNWQRVWLLPPPVENVQVNSLIWRPDGKVIAIAYSTCRVLLINVENKETLHAIPIPSNVTFMTWPQEREKESSSNIITKNNASEYLPKLPTVCRHFRTETEQNDENLEDIKKIKSQTVLNFLIICLEDGKILLNVFGIYNIGEIETNIHLPRGLHCDKILSCELSKNLSCLYVSVLVTSKATQNIKLLSIDTSILHDRAKELHTLSIKYGHVLSLLDYLSNTTNSLKETWENILLKEMQLKLINYAKLQPKGQISSDFLELLVFGTPSGSLERFLMRELCDKTIKKLGGVIEQNCLTMQRLILKHLYSFGQNLAYHISELKGMSKLATFSSLGLEEHIVSFGFSAVGAFLVKATEVQYVIDDFLKKHKAVFKWLHLTILKMTESIPENSNNDWSAQELQFIADYLCTFDELGNCDEVNNDIPNTQKIFLDTLGQYFIDKDLIKPYKHETNPWEILLKSNLNLSKHNLIIPRHNHLSLIQEINNLKSHIDNIFTMTNITINNSIKLRTIHQIKSMKNISQVSITCQMEDEKILLTYIDKDNAVIDLVEISEASNQVNIYSFHVSSLNVNTMSMGESGNYENQNNAGAVVGDKNLNIIDVQFYTSEILSVLIENDDESKNCIFVQIPISTLKSYIQSVYLDNNLTVPCYNGAMPGGTPRTQSINLRNILVETDFCLLESIVGYKFAASGTRNLLIILSETQRKIRLFEFGNENDDEDEEEGDQVMEDNDQVENKSVPNMITENSQDEKNTK